MQAFHTADSVSAPFFSDRWVVALCVFFIEATLEYEGIVIGRSNTCMGKTKIKRKIRQMLQQLKVLLL